MEQRKESPYIVGLMLKAVTILRKKDLPYTYWLDYLHTAKNAIEDFSGAERDVVAKIADCLTIEDAIKKAEEYPQT